MGNMLYLLLKENQTSTLNSIATGTHRVDLVIVHSHTETICDVSKFLDHLFPWNPDLLYIHRQHFRHCDYIVGIICVCFHLAQVVLTKQTQNTMVTHRANESDCLTFIFDIFHDLFLNDGVLFVNPNNRDVFNHATIVRRYVRINAGGSPTFHTRLVCCWYLYSVR